LLTSTPVAAGQLHAQAPRPEDTDWPQIARLYAALEEMTPTPVVSLNRAVAVAMADGPARGLPLVERLAGELDGYALYHAARADLLRRLGRASEARDAYRRARDLTTNATERGFPQRRIAELGRP
jgi:RNA polymerase sigma-70 factor (ECF subfamily)